MAKRPIDAGRRAGTTETTPPTGHPRPAPRRPAGDRHLPGDDRARSRSAARRASTRSTPPSPTAGRSPSSPSARPSRRTSTIPSELYTVGTLAKIAQVVQLQDGTVRAIVQGQSRLRVHRLQPDRAVPARRDRGARRRDAGRHRDPGADAHGPGPDRAVRRQWRPGPAGGRRRRPQHHRARAPGRHGRVQPGHEHRAAPGAARDDRRRRAPQARHRLPGQPGRDPRAEGQDPVRGQVRDGQDPARVHPARAAQGHPARARRGRPAAGRDQRAARQGRGRRHAGGDQGPGDQGDRPDEPDPVGQPGGRGHPDLRRLAGRPALGHVHGRPARHQGGGPILDEDHYGLEKIKERILEYLAVRTLADEIRSPILAFVGPPGVGKTSLGKSHRQGDGPQVRADEPRRHPRRGGDPRPPAHLHRRAARSDHPERSRRPGPTTRCSCSTRSTRSAWTSGATRVGPARGPRPGAEQHLPGQLPGGAVRPQQGPVRRHGQPARPHPGRPARPDGDRPPARLHGAGEDRDRQALPHPQADDTTTASRTSTSRSPTAR